MKNCGLRIADCGMKNCGLRIADCGIKIKPNVPGEARTYWLHQIANCNNILIIQLSSPASPLQNIDKTLMKHGASGARRAIIRQSPPCCYNCQPV
ncbi:MAG: hypothetical protein ACPGWR_03440 [Ardenticatenaceae bacterium]